MYRKFLSAPLIGVLLSLYASAAVSNLDDLEKTAKQMSSCAATFIVAQSAGLSQGPEMEKELKRRVKQMGLLSTYLVKTKSGNLSPSEAAISPQQWLTEQVNTYSAIKKLQGSEVMLGELTEQIQKCAALFPVVDTMSPLMYEDSEFVKYINQLPKT